MKRIKLVGITLLLPTVRRLRLRIIMPVVCDYIIITRGLQENLKNDKFVKKR